MVSEDSSNYWHAPIELTDKFWRNVLKGGPDDCWNWTGFKIRGYGRLNYRCKSLRAHRYSYAIHREPIPPGLNVCHSCDNRSCVNPKHLWLGTYKDNYLDCRKKGRHSHGRKHGRTKMTLSDVLCALNLFKKKGWPKKLIARRMARSTYAIRRILAGRGWLGELRALGELAK